MQVLRTKYSVANTYSSGQALVLVLMSLAVVLTVTLYIIARSVTDVSISSQEGQAVSAFSAAEAGVEQQLVSGIAGTNFSGVAGDAKYEGQVVGVGGDTAFVYPINLLAAENMTLWLRSQDASPGFPQNAGHSIKVCWGNPSTSSSSSTTPAIEVSFYYIDSGTGETRIYRATADPNSTRRLTNSFDSSNSVCTVDGQQFAFYKTLSSLPARLQFATIRMFYNTDFAYPLAFDSNGGGSFPNQGILVSSTGSLGQSNRKVSVFQGWPEVPSAFLYGIFSPYGLVK